MTNTQVAAVPRAAGAPIRIGVGIDASRYGHHAAFLRDDLAPAAAELSFAESAAGYAQLRGRLEKIAANSAAGVQFTIRLDAAGQYADNLLHFLQTLALPAASFTISCGDPQRNKNYRAALFGPQKSDPVEALAMARYALSEAPAAGPVLSLEQRLLRQVAGRLQGVVRQQTRLVNQLHHLLALVFPELALLTQDIAAGWVLELLHRYPTARRLAAASADDLASIPYLPHARIAELLAHAQSSIASLAGAAAEELVRDQVRQLRDGPFLSRLFVDYRDFIDGFDYHHFGGLFVDGRLGGESNANPPVWEAFRRGVDEVRKYGRIVDGVRYTP